MKMRRGSKRVAMPKAVMALDMESGIWPAKRMAPHPVRKRAGGGLGVGLGLGLGLG